MCAVSSSLKVVKQATIEFLDSNKTISWTESDGCLLDFTEANAIPVISSCRSGHCGACAVELLSGEVVYDQDASVELGGNEILLCSTKPAASHITLKL